MLSTVFKDNKDLSKEDSKGEASNDGQKNVITVMTTDGTRFLMSTERANVFAVNKILGGRLTALEHGNVLIAPNPDGTFSGLIPGARYAAHYVPDPTVRDPRQMAKKLALKQKPMSRKQVMSIFSHFDTDCSGAIDRDEFRAMAATMDLHMKDEDIDAVFTVADVDKNGTIDFDEFYDWLINTKKKGSVLKAGVKKLATHTGFLPQDNPEKILEIFNKIDTDKSGAIDPDEFRALVRSLHLKLADDEVMALFKSIDLDNNGTLEFNEFLTWWLGSICGNSSLSDAAWEVRLGISEAELEAATGLLKEKDKKKKGEDDDKDKSDDKKKKDEPKKPEKKVQCALKWTNVDKFGAKWRAPGSGKKEKDLQPLQYSKSQDTVALRGCLISEGEADAVAFTLPAGFTPKSLIRFTALVNLGKKNSSAEVTISPDGKVTVSSVAAGEIWFSNISFDI